MNYKHLLSVVMLLSSVASYASVEVNADTAAKAALYVVLTRLTTTNPVLAEMAARTKKVCLKDIATNYWPEPVREVVAFDVAGLGHMNLMDADTACEVLYQGYHSSNPNEVMVRTYVREKILQVVRNVMRTSGLECPVSGDLKGSWICHNAWSETLRYAIDMVLDQVTKRIPAK